MTMQISQDNGRRTTLLYARLIDASTGLDETSRAHRGRQDPRYRPERNRRLHR